MIRHRVPEQGICLGLDAFSRKARRRCADTSRTHCTTGTSYLEQRDLEGRTDTDSTIGLARTGDDRNAFLLPTMGARRRTLPNSAHFRSERGVWQSGPTLRHANPVVFALVFVWRVTSLRPSYFGVRDKHAVLPGLDASKCRLWSAWPTSRGLDAAILGATVVRAESHHAT